MKPIELEPFEGVADDKQLKKMLDGSKAEFTNLNNNIMSLKNFTQELYYVLRDKNFKNENFVSTEAASQRIGYIESKIMESIGTLDKIALELASQIDRSKENDNKTTDV